MAKREAENLLISSPPQKRACIQSSLHNFFSSSGSTSKPTFVEYTPEYLGIHLFSEQEISEVGVLEINYRRFWNEKVMELCEDKHVRHKLKDKSAIQGAINTSWTLHKSDLLALQVDELNICMRESYTEERTKEIMFSTIKSKNRVMEITDSIRHLYANTPQEMELEVSKIMKELRMTQSALKKSRRQDLAKVQKHVYSSEVSNGLSADELHHLVEGVKEESSDCIVQQETDMH